MVKRIYRNDLTQEYVKYLLNYDPETGLFHWAVDHYKCKAGDLAGTYSKEYVVITILSRKYRAHRLAWLYMTGEWPKEEIDHEDTNTQNNKWKNLREASGTQNCYNYPVKITNQLGVKGIHKTKNGKFKAQIQINKVKIYLGRFNTLEEAKAAHDEAANKYQEEFVHISIVKEFTNAS